MSRRNISSKQRFRQYERDIRRRQQSPPDASDSSAAPTDAPPRSSTELVLRFLALLRGQRLAVAFALLTLAISTFLALVPPAAIKFVIDYVLSGKPLPTDLPTWLKLPHDRWQLLLWILAGVVTVSFAQIGIRFWGRWHAMRATIRAQMSVRRRVFEHAMRLPLDRVEKLKSGGAASILREDAGNVAELIFGMLYHPLGALIQLLGSLCILAWIDCRLLAGAVLLIPLVYLTHRTWINRIRPQYRAIRACREAIDAQATEVFGGMRVVRAFGRQKSETGRFVRGNHLMSRQELLVWWWERCVDLAWDALIPLGSAALLLYGGWQVLEGHLTLGDLTMFLVYLVMLLEPLAVLSESATEIQNSLSGLDRVLDLLDESSEMPSTADAVKPRTRGVTGHITLEDVSFKYPSASRFALRHVCLDVRPGEIVALVGPSGAGKTTLCNLVARFYDATTGRVLLDGRDVRDIDNYRSLLGVVEQEVFLFDGTIADNIGYSNRHTTDEDIRQAAAIANATEFIRCLPAGFETLVGERGVMLSGGQRQRIAIARAVLAGPRILVLDEATSNLDQQSERLIQASLKALMRGRTTFVIAHRLSTIRHADRIVLLENGSITETRIQNELEELMETDSQYRRMFRERLLSV